MSSSLETTSSVRAGNNAESAVIQSIPELEYVPGDEPGIPDARVSTVLSPSPRLPFVGVCVLEKGTDVEIKSAAAVVNQTQRRGRFNLRKRQHDSLLERAGSYLFAVCEPRPERPVIAMKIVPATIVNDVVGSWIPIEDDSRSEVAYAQLTWTAIFDVSEVEEP
ncbi:hypothetical protein [Halorarius halobius]|uniref:hypothetical protein n=1 Tax=Halorarius halobius TaxID=2962671 RepID=UPI0020CC4C42|nr:hypothetical protein [Halorarius halobius]